MKVLCINCKPDFTYFKNKGLDLSVDYLTTNQIFPLIPTGNPNIFTPDIYNYAKQFTGYTAVIIGYNPSLYDSRLNNTGGYTYPVPFNNTFFATVRLDPVPQNLYPVHEMMHVLCNYINLIFGDHTPKDFMDNTLVNGVWKSYYENDYNKPDPNSNFNQTWRGILPFLPRLNMLNTMPIVDLHRFSDDGVQTLGDLSTPNLYCKTLERPWKNNRRDISCIPTGTYTCKWTFSPRLMRYTYEIMNVPNRTGIRFHPGNYFFDVDGCILLGTGYGDLNHDKEADLLNSRVTLTKFEQIMGKKSFTLVIHS